MRAGLTDHVWTLGEHLLSHGTTLLAIHIAEGCAMAADDMIYTIQNGSPVPSLTNVRKVFSTSGGNYRNW